MMLKMKMSRSRMLLHRSRQLLSRGRSVSTMIMVSSLGRKNSYVNEQIRAPSDALGKNTAAEIPTPSGPIGKDQDNSSQSPGPSSTLGKDQAKSSQSPRPSAAKGRGNASGSVDPIAVRRSSRSVRKVTTT
ncbi:unnamed protein product [Eruca vesicaria subsp. sativa]|uniref:Uncharacterized protein n=1 Tax=Eruca vesicaria subsp. sativa TaxID=29727 RepID=A0ABC8ISS3_ERUVS|nr:unnamed protein product [Eruca vesicaria subsp. sativa]